MSIERSNESNLGLYRFRKARNFALYLVIHFLVLSQAVPRAYSQGGGPPGGQVMSLAIHPISPATMYAGTSGGGVFKTIDAAATWTAVNSGLPLNGLYAALAIDPVAPATVYV